MSQPYAKRFPVGSRVRIAPRPLLELFLASWRCHHPLTAEQLGWAGDEVEVIEAGTYHGGDALYVVKGARGVSGYWHEPCLAALDE